MLLSSFTFWAQDDQYVFRECSCDCDDLIPTSNDIILKVSVKNEIEKSIRMEDIVFEINGERFEGKRYHNGEYQILIENFSIQYDSIILEDELVGFEQNETEFVLESDHIYKISLSSNNLSNRVMGGVLTIERMINSSDTKVTTIYSEEIRDMPRK
ncbi:MAG: hypothetical protein ACI9N1_001972 [Flavobacteriales bacterium]|jgi:hypothetical protein